MAIPLFKHDFISLKTQKAPYTTSAHLRYIMRKSATSSVCFDGLPAGYRQYHAAQRFFDAQENNARKNARLVDKFIIAVPKEFSEAEAYEVLRMFGERISNRYDAKSQKWMRASYLFTLQDWDSHNPHAHFVFRDADVETGKRVFRTTDLGSTARLKLEWESTVNEMFAERGENISISFRDAEERAAMKAEECPPMPVANDDKAPNPEPADVSQETSDEDEMEKLTPREATMVASDFYTELRHLRDLQVRAVVFKDAVQSAQKNLEVAEREMTAAYGGMSAAEKALYTATTRLQEYVKSNGKLRGFEIGIGRLSWKSPTRKEAESAQATHDALQSELKAAERTYQSTLDQVSRWESSRDTQQDQLNAVTHELETFRSQYGEDATLEDAEHTLSHTAHAYMEGVSKEDLLDLYETNQISTSQYRDGLELLGETQLLNELEEKMLENLDERIESLGDDESL